MAIVESVKFINSMLNEEIELTRKSKVYNLEVLDLGSIQANISTYDLYNKDGLSVQNIKYGTRTITLVGWLIGANDRAISTLRRRVNRFFNPKHYITILQNGYKISGYPVHTVEYGTEMPVMNDKFCRFLVEFLCDFPLFTTESMQSVIIANWENKWHFPLEFTYENETQIFGLKSESIIANVDNNSDVPSGMKITFIANSVVDTPRITNIENQEYIELSYVMQAGDKIIVDTTGVITNSILIKADGSIVNVLNSITDLSSQSMALPIGKSSLTYSALQNQESLSVSVDYMPLFLEVI